MLIGIVRTVGSPCRCAEAAAEGLRTLGHTPVLADSEEIEVRAFEFARACDFVIDHTDRFNGKGLLRFHVRRLLESFGARIVGSDSRACFLADNKIAAKFVLSSAGIPTPPGMVISSNCENIAFWLTPPYVIKPAYEHMSRAVKVARTREEAGKTAAQLLLEMRQALLLESYVAGRELALSLIEEGNRVRCLPPLEWRIGAGETVVLTESFKLQEVPQNRRDAVRADLSSSKLSELNTRAIAAFRALGLRDYARFDVKLTPDGTFVFLEANVTPSLEPEEALALSAHWDGIDYPSLLKKMLAAAERRYDRRQPEPAETTIALPTGSVTVCVPKGVHQPPASTIELAYLLDVKPGERVLELGCGSGLLSVTAAKLGASHVVATDIDGDALDTTLLNARRNGVGDQVEVRAGSWYEALSNRKTEKFDVIIATPPQTPGKKPFGPHYGGIAGTDHLLAVVENAPYCLRGDAGRLWILVISLVDTKAVVTRLRERFEEVSVLMTTDRFFTPEEYEAYDNGLFTYLLSLKQAGRSEFEETSAGTFVFRNRFIRAGRPRGS